MKLAVYSQGVSMRRLTGLYITALSLVGLFALTGQLYIQFALQQQSSDALVINIAGRQRMLSQKISKTALAIPVFSDPTARSERVEEMRNAVNLWEHSHRGLQQGDAQLGLPGDNSYAVNRLFAAIKPNYEAMLNAAKQLLTQVDADQTQPFSKLKTDILPFTQTILTQEPGFLTGMDAIVSQYQNEAEAKVTRLKLTEVALLSLTLLVLFLEGTFVFRPAIKKLRKGVMDLMRAEEQIHAHTKELERKNADLELAFAEAMAAHRKVVPHARVVVFGHYQVQGRQGNYYNVMSHEVNGNLLLECECLMYQRHLICSHSIAAASLHSALLRHQHQRHSSFRWTSNFSPDQHHQSGDLSSGEGVS